MHTHFLVEAGTNIEARDFLDSNSSCRCRGAQPWSLLNLSKAWSFRQPES